jgi:hypothetical protein
MKSLHPVHDEPMRHYPHVIRTLAFHSAIKLVKEQIRARGLKLHEWSMKDIHIEAEKYLETHRDELIRVTIARVRSDPAFRSLAEKEARRRGRMWPLPPDRPRDVISSSR